MNPSPLFICGPTASGKTGFALAIAKALDGEIINADAFQLYRGLEVLTAAPNADEQSEVPHHLYGISNPAEAHDAEGYRRLAQAAIEDVVGRGRVPLVVGGSGLYLKFLTHGPSPLPTGDPALREKLEATPLPALVRQLEERDPETASTIDTQNRRYVQRALEICLLTGQPASALRQSFTNQDENALCGLVIEWPRAVLHERIETRTRQMLDSGALDEVAALPDDSPASRAIGVKQIRAHLAGEITLATCLEQIAAATRQYAKRQETWFRRESWLKPVPGEISSPELTELVQRRFPKLKRS